MDVHVHSSAHGHTATQHNHARNLALSLGLTQQQVDIPSSGCTVCVVGGTG